MHTAANDIPPEFTLLRVAGPNLAITALSADDLPAEWQMRPDITRDIGTEWLRKNEAVLLRIPSAIVPETANFLFNPLHPNAKSFHITQALSYPFDTRIKR